MGLGVRSPIGRVERRLEGLDPDGDRKGWIRTVIGRDVVYGRVGSGRCLREGWKGRRFEGMEGTSIGRDAGRKGWKGRRSEETPVERVGRDFDWKGRRSEGTPVGRVGRGAGWMGRRLEGLDPDGDRKGRLEGLDPNGDQKRCRSEGLDVDWKRR